MTLHNAGGAGRNREQRGGFMGGTTSSLHVQWRIADSGNVVHLDVAANRGQRGGHPPGAAANHQ